MYRIGILEDDINLGNELKVFLESNGYEGHFIVPSAYKDKDEAGMIQLLTDASLSLLLLDIRLPGFDGIRLCKAFREKSSVPVIMITSDNSELTELISIQSGADDFVPKPFNTRILLARMEGVLRRVHGHDEKSDIKKIELENGLSFTIDTAKARISSGDDETELSKNEFMILMILVKNLGRIVSRDDIISELWDDGNFVDDNTLTVNMTRLKQRLSQIGIAGAVSTKRGAGYMLN